MPITFPNPNIGLGKRDIKFSGEVPGHRGPVICSIGREVLAEYAALPTADDAQLLVAFETHRRIILTIAAAHWGAGEENPKVTREDLLAFPAQSWI